MTRILIRDILIASRSGGNWAQGSIFFILFLLLSALALGPEQAQRSTLAPALVWLATALSSQLSLDTLFSADMDDGFLDCWVADDRSLIVFVLGKFIAHWLVALLPILVLAPIGAIMLGAPMATLPVLILSLFIGGPALVFFGGMASALTANLRGSGLLVVLLSGPLLASPLIFGVGAVQAGMSFAFEFKILAAITLMAAVVSTVVSAMALKVHLE